MFAIPGTSVDLTYLNRKKASGPIKKSFESATSQSQDAGRKLWDVGTRVVYLKWFPSIETIVITPA